MRGGKCRVHQRIKRGTAPVLGNEVTRRFWKPQFGDTLPLVDIQPVTVNKTLASAP